MEVHKFGGSAFRDRETFSRVVDLIGSRSSDGSLVVMVSAAYGVTSYLLESLHSRVSADSIVLHLRGIYDGFYSADIGSLLAELTDLIVVYYDGLLEVQDRILSYGERLMAVVLGSCLGADVIFAESFLVTDGVYGSARVDHASTRALVSSLSFGDLTVVPGYYGARGGDVTLLGRSGTDYAATSLAFALGLGEVTIWKDVGGFMTADPHVVEGARPLFHLRYDQAEMLSFFGARVLHPLTIDAARRGDLRIRVRELGSDHVTDISGGGDRSVCLSFIRGVGVSDIFSLSSVLLFSLSSDSLSLVSEGDLSLIYISGAVPELGSLVGVEYAVTVGDGVVLLVSELEYTINRLHDLFYS